MDMNPLSQSHTSEFFMLMLDGVDVADVRLEVSWEI